MKLSALDRYRFDLSGFLLVEDVLDVPEVSVLRCASSMPLWDEIHDLKRELREVG